MGDTAQISATNHKAWILPVDSMHVAIGEFELVYIIAGWQRYMPIPRSPAWCHHVFLWQGRLLPLFDLENYLKPAQVKPRASASDNRDIVGVIAYENRNKEIYYGGLKLSAPPVIRVVTDDEICDYPGTFTGWDKIALSCFEIPDIGAVPILDIQHIFCAASQTSAIKANSTIR